MSVRLPALVVLPVFLLTAACAQDSPTPLSPSASDTSSTANPDGATLKVAAPVIVSPRAGEVVTTRQPLLVFANAAGRFVDLPLHYRLEAFDAAGTLLGSFVIDQGANGQTIWASAADLPWDAEFAWRVRAELEGRTGPWSTTERFRTPVQATPRSGAPRDIGIGEAFDIIARIHDELRFDLGSRSSREGRVAFWTAGVAAVHYGHLRFNPRGPDAGWCIKDAGGGRPISDDVIVRCGSRDFWDLIGGVGANGYVFRINYDGRLPGSQNVYPPPAGALAILDR